jgi:hypothetical protein
MEKMKQNVFTKTTLLWLQLLNQKEKYYPE